MSDDTQPARASVEVALGPTEAFALFTAGMSDWWPAEFSWSGALLERMEMDPREGGLLHEIGPEGFRLDWGRVLDWDPPERIVLSWQIGPDRVPQPDPARSSEVELRFSARGGGCRVDVEHRGFDRHGDGAAGYAEAMGSQGWPHLLACFAGVAARG